MMMKKTTNALRDSRSGDRRGLNHHRPGKSRGAFFERRLIMAMAQEETKIVDPWFIPFEELNFDQKFDRISGNIFDSFMLAGGTSFMELVDCQNKSEVRAFAKNFFPEDSLQECADDAQIPEAREEEFKNMLFSQWVDDVIWAWETYSEEGKRRKKEPLSWADIEGDADLDKPCRIKRFRMD